MAQPGESARATLKTTDPTNEAVRRLGGRMTSMTGLRVTHDRLISALAALGEQYPETLAGLIAPVSEGTSAAE